MHLRQILWNIRRAVILPWICTEPSNLQVKFHSKIAFHDWCYWHYRYFILRLIRVTLTKFWWNELTSSRTRYFAINSQFLLEFLKSKTLLPIFSSNANISICTLLFSKKSKLFRNFQVLFFLFYFIIFVGVKGREGRCS